MKNSNPVIWRRYVKGKLKTLSPMIIGCGDDEFADIQFIRDGADKPFIPASSIAGVLRAFARDLKDMDEKRIKLFFGDDRKEDSVNQSFSVFYDLPVEDGYKLVIRDGVSIDSETKTAEDQKKFDYETVDSGACFDFKMELSVRKNQKDFIKSLDSLLDILLSAMKKKEVRLGAKVNRGFGRVELEDIKEALFDFSTDNQRKMGQSWLNFDWAKSDFFEPWKKVSEYGRKTDQVAISADFDIDGAVLIRSYPKGTDPVDTVHITSNNKPVIPGTSWAGVLQCTFDTLAKEMGKNIDFIKKDLFGYVDEKSNERSAKASASRILIEESVISGGDLIPYTRNKIDRFTGGVVKSALFTEKPQYGGQVAFKCIVKKSKGSESEKDPSVGLLLLSLLEIGNGLAPLGGSCSIGRGILSLKSVQLDGESVLVEKKDDGNVIWSDKAKAYIKATAEYFSKEAQSK